MDTLEKNADTLKNRTPGSFVQALFRPGLTRDLTLWFLFLALTPVLLASWIGLEQTKKILFLDASRSMTLRAEDLSRHISNWFEQRFHDVEFQATNTHNVKFVEQLNRGSRNKEISSYVNTPNWKHTIRQHQSDLNSFIKAYNYYSNGLILDLDGNVVYSAETGQHIDAGINVFADNQFDAKLIKHYKSVLNTKKTAYSDLIKTHNNHITSYISSPVFNSKGYLIGILSVEITITDIHDILNVNSGIRNYLVGSDLLLRSTIDNQANNQALETIINTRKTIYWDESPAAKMDQDLSAIEGALSYIDPFGQLVIGVHRAIHLGNIRWFLIVEESQEHVLKPAHQSIQFIMSMFLLLIASVIPLAVYIAGRKTRPLLDVIKATAAAAEGNFNHSISVKRKDEIGLLAQGFNELLDARQRHEAMLEDNVNTIEQMLHDLAEQRFAIDQHAIVAVTDVKGIISFVNDKFTAISGYSRDELIGKNHRILNSGHHSTEFFRDMYRTIAKGNVWHGEICNRNKNGALYWVDTTIVPFLKGDGKPRSYIAIRTDITDRVRTEQELTDARDAAQDATKLKSEFLASMSHEIRTPMNGILGMLSLLLNSELNKEQRQQAALAGSSANSLLTLINDILDFSKVEAGKLDLELLEFDLIDMVNDTVKALAQQAQDKKLEIMLDVTDVQHRKATGDPSRIRQVLNNLVSNAIKFTHRGEIVICASTYVDENNECSLHCQIRDTGIGIPKEKVSLLFDSFTQVDASTTRTFGGTGLGLAIVKQLCQLMGGDVSVTSELGSGSCFEFFVRLRNARSVAAIPDFPTTSVLLVSPTTSLLTLLQKQIGLWKARVSSSDNPENALQQLHSNRFDLILIDSALTNTGAFKLAKAIHKHDPQILSKLVLLTPFVAPELGYLKSLGFNGCIKKPVGADELENLFIFLNQEKQPSEEWFFNDREDTRQLNQHQMNNSRWKDIRILLVEDNQVNQLVAQGMLHELGLDCDIAANGLEALTTLENSPEYTPYTLIFMDCQMPEMDGYETTRRIRLSKAGKRYEQIPIIAMTANAMKGDKEKCIAAGMNDYLSKPVEIQQLALMLDKWQPSFETSSAHTTTTTTAPNAIEPGTLASDQSSNKREVWNRKEILNRMGGKEASLGLLVKVFLQDAPMQFELLGQTIRTEQLQEAGAIVHTIKGSSGTIGGQKLHWVATHMDAAAKHKDLEEMKHLWPQFEAEAQNLLDCLQQWQQSQITAEPTEKQPAMDTPSLTRHLQQLLADLQNGDYIDPQSVLSLCNSLTEQQVLLRQLSDQISLFNTEKAVEILRKISTAAKIPLDLGDSNAA
ncbi:MAG: response regulator [Gammaproteobacteria bacterium]|nr:response regulator [Gammaproteobacteria bacterium]MDH5801778.1 response regulator [Gammaproteobacteria bacterium]